MTARRIGLLGSLGIALLVVLVGASTASAAEAMLTGIPKFQVRVADIVTEHWSTSYKHRATFLDQVTVQISGAVSCTMVEGPVDPDLNTVVLTLVDDNRVKDILLPNPCDQFGLATGIYDVGQSWVEAESIYELGGVTVPVGRKKLHRRYPIRVDWAGGVLPTRVVTVKRSGFRKGFRRIIYDTDFDNYFNICIKKGLDLHARGGHLYCIWERPDSSLTTVRVS